MPEVKDAIVYQSPDQIPVTEDNKKFMGAKRPGRPKAPDSIVEALKEELPKDQNSRKIARAMIKVAINEKGKYTNAQVQAAMAIADRIDGKPVQSMLVGAVHMDEQTTKRLVALMETIRGIQ
jgi:hypothetical protein